MSAEPIRSKEEQEETIDFLRSRGVEISLPEEREQAEKAAEAVRNLTLDTPGTRGFKYVRIPADDSQPLEELTAVVYSDERGVGDQMPDLLVPLFRGGHVDSEALKHSTLQQMSQQAGDASLLDRMTPDLIAQQGGAAEKFRLSDTVQMYLDEIGSLKRLPPNARASAMAAQCGYGAGVPFCGDMYISRISAPLSADPGAINVDFTVADMSPESPWLRTAAQENLAHQAQHGGGVGGMSAEELATAGGKGDGYTWSQDETEVEVILEVPEGTGKKEVKAQFKPGSFKVAVASKGFEASFELFSKVSSDDCTWTWLDARQIAITMEKATEGESWLALVKEGGFTMAM